MTDHRIHILPEQIASQIAAGEVIERPAAAVKEMAENSLDAGARAISIEIRGGGRDLIAIADDGCGMNQTDAILSIRRHATSKIRDAADLAAVRTLGFRGEALAAIASVAQLTIKTRRAADQSGVELIASGGNITESRACAMAPGAAIEVRDLFFNTPARLKFLKSGATEQATIAESVQRLALANTGVAFTLAADGRTVFELPRARSLNERFRRIFGPKMADQMLPFEFAEGTKKARGLVSQSQVSFASSRMAFTFVNGRTVRDRMLARAIAQACQTLIPRGRYPAVLLFIELPPEEVDVNVHPTKAEVRFRNAGAVFELAYHALRERLSDQRSAPVEEPRPIGADSAVAAAIPWPAPEPENPLGNDRQPRALRLVADSSARSFQPALGLGYGPSRHPENAAPTQATTARIGLAPSPAASPTYSSFRILGQLMAGYIALEGPDGLLLVDQHAAHERVTFEKLRAQMRSGGIQTQALLAPVPLELSPARRARIEASLPEFRALGFELEAFGASALLLKGAPAAYGADSGLKLLMDMLDSIGDGGLRLSGETAFEDWLKQLACHGSIRVGRALSLPEMSALLDELDRTEFKTNCPHGRPVHINFPRGQIERMFRR